jgi:hypothetical protein
VPGVSFQRREALIDGGADERMNEPEQTLRAEDVDSREVRDRLRGRLLVEASKRGGMVSINILSEDRDGLGKPRRVAR